MFADKICFTESQKPEVTPAAKAGSMDAVAEAWITFYSSDALVCTEYLMCLVHDDAVEAS